MRILLVSYFFSPLQNVAAERWKRFATSLRSKGHAVTVISGPWGKSSDEVRHLEDPYSADAKRLGEGAATRSESPLKKLKSLAPAFLLIDGKWGWSLKAAAEIGRLTGEGQRPDLVVITGTPWSTVAAGAEYCHHKGLPYVLDFRDYWSDEHYLRLSSPLARRYFRILERRAIKHAAGLITVNDVMAGTFRKTAGAALPIASMPNGFDGPLSEDATSFLKPKGGVDLITYAGSTSPYSELGTFLETLESLDGGSQAIASLGFMGDDPMKDLARYPQVRKTPTLPATEALEALKIANVLLFTLAPMAKNYTTGKLMTYVAAQRPILYYGPVESPAAKLIRNHGLGWVIANGDTSALATAIMEIGAATASGTRFPLKPDLAGLCELSTERIGARLNDFLQEVSRVRHRGLS